MSLLLLTAAGCCPFAPPLRQQLDKAEQYPSRRFILPPSGPIRWFMQKPKKERAQRLKSEKPSHHEGFNRQVWRVVDGAIRDAFKHHPDYLTVKGTRAHCARRSVAKRVTGALLSYLEQSKRGRSG